MSERLAPQAILVLVNLTGTVSEIQDDPDSADANWLDAISDGNDTDVRVSFPSPSAPLLIGSGLQEFRVLLRATGGGDDPIATLFLYEAGILRVTGTPVPIPSTTGQVVSFTWDAVLLLDPTGAGVECRVNGLAQGGFLDPEDTVEVGAIEWNAAVIEQHNASYNASGGSSGAAGSGSIIPDFSYSSGGATTQYVGEFELLPIGGFGSSGATALYIPGLLAFSADEYGDAGGSTRSDQSSVILSEYVATGGGRSLYVIGAALRRCDVEIPEEICRTSVTIPSTTRRCP